MSLFQTEDSWSQSPQAKHCQKLTCTSYLEACCLEKLRNLLNRECICSLKCRLWKLITLMYQNHHKRNELSLENHSGWKCGVMVVVSVFLGCPTAGQACLPKPEGLKLSGWALAQSIWNGKCRTSHSKHSFSAILNLVLLEIQVKTGGLKRALGFKWVEQKYVQGLNPCAVWHVA